MTNFAMNILYVDNPAASVGFYAGLLGKEPLEASPNFAMFELKEGQMLGLWSRRTVEPVPVSAPGSGELAMMVDSRDEVDGLHADWAARGLAILQTPRSMDFGYTFVATDPDGNRLRVFSPEGP